jgi:hypothetical protein
VTRHAAPERCPFVDADGRQYARPRDHDVWRRPHVVIGRDGRYRICRPPMVVVAGGGAVSEESSPEMARAVARLGLTITYPDGTICDRRTGDVLWRPGDDPSKKPGATSAPPASPIDAAPRLTPASPPQNFDLVAGRFLRTPETARAVRFEQDRFLSQLVPLSPGRHVEVQHHDRDTWHPSAECWTGGCRDWPVWRRSVLECEVVWETDKIAGDGSNKAASYALNVPSARKVVSVIARLVGPMNRRAFAAFQSGQKSIHVVLYLILVI